MGVETEVHFERERHLEAPRRGLSKVSTVVLAMTRITCASSTISESVSSAIIALASSICAATSLYRRYSA